MSAGWWGAGLAGAEGASHCEDRGVTSFGEGKKLPGLVHMQGGGEESNSITIGVEYGLCASARRSVKYLF